MASINHDQEIVRRYLLGQLADDEEGELEQRLLIEDDLFMELEVTEDELVEDYVAGHLIGSERKWYEQNFLASPEGKRKHRFARALGDYLSSRSEGMSPAPPVRLSWWRQPFFASPLAIAATALILVGISFGVWRGFFQQSDVDKGLIALNAAYREQRPVEARLSQLDYAPYSVTRSQDSERVDALARDRAERYLLDAVAENPTPVARHALGKLHLVKKDFDRAIEQFELARRKDPNNAQVYADLGAALLEKGKLEMSHAKPSEPQPHAGGGLENVTRGLENLNEALQIAPDLLEALFNRALAYESMLLPSQAAEAWKSYLEKDRNSQWAEEALRRLGLLEKQLQKTSYSNEAVLKSFLTAYRNGDPDAAWLTIRQHRDLTGGPVANGLLDEHLSLAADGHHDEASKKLDALAYVGRLEQERAGDFYVSDLVRFLRSLSASRRNDVLTGRQLMKQGRECIFQSQPETAADYYSRAKSILYEAGDTTQTIYIDYPLGHAYLGQSNSRLALSTFREVAEQSEARQYKWLMAQALNAMANAEIGLKSHSAALATSNRALKLSEQIGDIAGVIKTTNQLAQQYFYLGNYPKSLDFHQRSLKLSYEYPTEPIQVWRNYFSVPRTLNAMGLHSAAIEYELEALRSAKQLKMPQIVCRSHAILGLMYAGQGNYQEAARNIEISIELAKNIPSEGIRNEQLAYSSLQLGLVNRLAGEFDKAIANYDQAVQRYGELKDFQPFSYVAHKGRLLSCISLQGCVSVEEDVETCLNLFENFRHSILEQSNRDSFFDTEQDIYDVAIGYEFSRHNSQRAFEYSERARARSLLDQADKRTRVIGTGNQTDIRFDSSQQAGDFSEIKLALPERAQILQYAVLEDKVLMWLISRNRFEAVEKTIAISTLNETLLSYLKRLSSPSGQDSESLTHEGKALFEILIQPIAALLEKDKLLCIVPDKTLTYLPFAALISPQSGKYLVDEYEIIYAPSSSMFIRSTELARDRKRDNETLLAVGNPRFNREEFRLPDLPAAVREVEEIRKFYAPSSLVLTGEIATKNLVNEGMPRANVLHLAAHSIVDEVSPLRSKMLLSSKPGSAEDDDVLQAHEIYASHLPNTHLVVLPACETGIGRYYRGEGMMGLSRSFIAANVPLVVSTLWRIDSESTADLMIAFHKHRTIDGRSSSKSLQLAQQAMANGVDNRYRLPYYWAAFTLAGGYADY